METNEATIPSPGSVRRALREQRAETRRLGEGMSGAAAREARALDRLTMRTDASALAWMLTQHGEGDTGHGTTIKAPEAWGEWSEARRQAYATGCLRRLDSNGMRTGSQAPFDIDAALDVSDDAPTPERVTEARDALLACVVLSDDTDRATIRAMADAVGAIVVEAGTEATRRAQRANRARAVARSLRWKDGLPHGATVRIAAALGVSPRLARKRIARLRANVAPIRDALRLCGRVRSDARAPLLRGLA